MMVQSFSDALSAALADVARLRTKGPSSPWHGPGRMTVCDLSCLLLLRRSGAGAVVQVYSVASRERAVP